MCTDANSPAKCGCVSDQCSLITLMGNGYYVGRHGIFVSSLQIFKVLRPSLKSATCPFFMHMTRYHFTTSGALVKDISDVGGQHLW